MNLEEQIKLIVENSGLKLYDIVTKKEHERNIFRVVVTSKDGVNLDKCAEISRLISPILDIDEPMGGKYNLEVSSPGIERKLKKPEHFIASFFCKSKRATLSTPPIINIPYISIPTPLTMSPPISSPIPIGTHTIIVPTRGIIVAKAVKIA